MAVKLRKPWDITIGDGNGLACMMGLNVLEDDKLALETAAHLKQVTSELGLPFIFKASFDKANRSSIKSFRGPGMEKGLEILAKVKKDMDIPIITDVHETYQAAPVAEVADILQVPAFLCRQTDLIAAITEAAAASGALIHVKKGQFLAPEDCKNILDKIGEAGGNNITILCDRGTSFGYHNLIVDMVGIDVMKRMGAPVSIDATHSAQLPGAGGGGTRAGGRRDAVPLIAASAIAAGADAVFLEFHPDPEKAKCDGPSCLPLADAKRVLTRLKRIYEASRPI